MKVEDFQLSIVIPTYNEKENIEPLINEIREEVTSAVEYDIVIVDDDSPDGTWLKALNKINCSDVVVRRINLKGLSTAIIDGILFSNKEYVAGMDADLQHPPRYIDEMIKSTINENADVVIASRYKKGGGVEGWSALRLIVSRGATLIAKLLLPSTRRISDPMSGFFMVKRSIVAKNLSKMNPMGFKVLLEILERGSPSIVTEVPYIFRGRLYGKSKLRMKTIIAYILHVLNLCGWRPIKFGIVGAIGTLVNLCVIAFFNYYLPALASGLFVLGSGIAIEASTLSNFIMHEIWTFKDRRVGHPYKRLVLFHTTILPSLLTQLITANIIFYGTSTNPILSQLLGIIIGFPVNYVLSELGIWKKGGGYPATKK
ncbi:MAG: glycosyltransferase family 2 protein [Ignisphaera sp.]|nr:glycosyltransferase family 2 protein [Ignisphaera sp.]